MKTLLISFAMFFTSVSFANEKFEEHKTKMLGEMDAHIAALQEKRSCFSGATDFQGAKKCHEEFEGKMKEVRAKHIDEKIKRLQERKEKMGK